MSWPVAARGGRTRTQSSAHPRRLGQAKGAWLKDRCVTTLWCEEHVLAVLGQGGLEAESVPLPLVDWLPAEPLLAWAQRTERQ